MFFANHSLPFLSTFHVLARVAAGPGHADFPLKVTSRAGVIRLRGRGATVSRSTFPHEQTASGDAAGVLTSAPFPGLRRWAGGEGIGGAVHVCDGHETADAFARVS